MRSAKRVLTKAERSRRNGEKLESAREILARLRKVREALPLSKTNGASGAHLRDAILNLSRYAMNLKDGGAK